MSSGWSTSPSAHPNYSSANGSALVLAEGIGLNAMGAWTLVVE